METDYGIAHAAAWDAGNRHAETNGREVWNEDDYNAACAEFARLTGSEAAA
jgi:hypothetical protein